MDKNTSASSSRKSSGDDQAKSGTSSRKSSGERYSGYLPENEFEADSTGCVNGFGDGFKNATDKAIKEQRAEERAQKK
jgi:hypothetical protein